ncbi:alpha/beta hydrolase [Phenylobacterium sp. J426]|uniref:alpha/beta fold hydrolase n=1 Tax=Phenylobacterium sp. J426 TaxID=2898439 RepID=UPI002151159B|nr:alpha/beta hydrolase [Phenylobacterium sp. J426]MCR5876409.1 alpha/beta hydrolase [Phenylobacterium sp. J426]
MSMAVSQSLVRHLWLKMGADTVFYREAGPDDGPVLLLPHGYPCSSYAYRNLIPRLSGDWRLIAPDFPGCGYSDTPPDFAYGFDGYAAFLERFCRALGVERFALYLHDFGSQIGLRLAIRQPARILGLIIQNGDIYEDQLGPKYAPLQAYFRDPTPEAKLALGHAVSREGFRDEFLNQLQDEHADLIPPDLWELHWSLMTPQRREIAVDLIARLKDNLGWFPRYQAYLREQQPPTLIVWGTNDGYMPAGAAEAYRRDLPGADLHLFEGGHWLLETHLEDVAPLIGGFLSGIQQPRA